MGYLYAPVVPMASGTTGVRLSERRLCRMNATS
jgi:hypothetical protein